MSKLPSVIPHAKNRFPVSQLAWDWSDLATMVTPEMALAFLATKAPNRSIARVHVDRLKADILNGNWADAPNVLAFDESGQLIDGQHRCTAIVEANIGVPCILVTGFPASTIDVIDTGRTRTMANVLAIKGEPNANKFAAIARTVVWYCTAPMTLDFDSLSRASNTEVINLTNLPARQANIHEAIRLARKAENVCHVSNLGTVMYLGCVAKGRWSLGEDFCTALGTGENLTADDPRLLLRNRLLQARAARINLNRKTQFILIAKTWNAWITGRRLGKLVLGRDLDELAVPSIDGCPRQVWPEDLR